MLKAPDSLFAMENSARFARYFAEKNTKTRVFLLASCGKDAKMEGMSQTEDRNGRTAPSAPQVFKWEMVRKALKAAEEGVYSWEIANNQIYYTEQCLRMMKWPDNSLAPNIFTEYDRLIHEEDRAFFQSEVQKYLLNPMASPLRVEVRLLHQGSRGWRWIRVNGLLERDEKKQPARLVGVWVDITRRKMADLHAMEDRDLFRTLIDYLPDNIFFKSRDSRFVLANKATIKKMGVPTPADIIGRADKNFFSPETAEIARREEEQVMRTGVPITNRVHREQWKTGGYSWCKLSKFPWYASDGSVKGIVGIASDVTELVEARDRYRHLTEQLNERNRALIKEIDLAREIQQALQPERIPARAWQDDAQGVLRSARFHHIYEPSAGVAGDCFHVFPVGEAAVGMLICDVMGHGVRAALIASMLRGLMEQVSNLADTPALLLSSLNRQLCHIFSKANITMFATACYLYLDLDKRRLTLSGAGHPAPIVVPRSGAAFLPAIPRSPALGLLETAMYRESELPLEDGLRVMLYTDGLTEAQNPAGDELGVERVLSHLQASPTTGNIRDMLEAVLHNMHTFTSQAGQEDDICLLGVEVLERY